MDAGSVSTVLAQSAVSEQVGVGVLKALQNLDQNLAARLFSSIGIGQNIDISA